MSAIDVRRQPPRGGPSRRLLSLLISSLATVVAACGSDGLGQRYSVSGTVNYQGKPLEKGEIGFVPDDPAGHAAFGKIEAGSYSLSTIGDGDGALPGKYKVTITSKEVDLSKAEAQFKAANTKGTQTAVIPKDFMIKAARSAKSNIPSKYNTPTTSGLEAEVKPQSNTFPFELAD